MKLIIFTRKSQEVPVFPKRKGLEVQHVCFESHELADLLLVAKYRIINYPTWVVINPRGKVLLKIKGDIPEEYIDQLI